MRGLLPMVVDLDSTHRRVQLEGRHQGDGPYGIATVIFGLAPFVVAEALGWPSAPEVIATFERHS